VTDYSASSTKVYELIIRNLLAAAYEAGVQQDVIDAAEAALEALVKEDEKAPRYCTATGLPWMRRAFDCARELGAALGLHPENAYTWSEKLKMVREQVLEVASLRRCLEDKESTE